MLEARDAAQPQGAGWTNEAVTTTPVLSARPHPSSRKGGGRVGRGSLADQRSNADAAGTDADPAQPGEVTGAKVDVATRDRLRPHLAKTRRKAAVPAGRLQVGDRVDYAGRNDTITDPAQPDGAAKTDLLLVTADGVSSRPTPSRRKAGGPDDQRDRDDRGSAVGGAEDLTLPASPDGAAKTSIRLATSKSMSSRPKPSRRKTGGSLDHQQYVDRQRRVERADIDPEIRPGGDNHSHDDLGEVGVDRAACDNHTSRVDPDLITLITAEHRMNRRWVKGKVAMANRASACCLGFFLDHDAIGAGEEAREAAFAEAAKKGSALKTAAIKGGEHPLAAPALALMLPFVESEAVFDRHIAGSDRRLAALAAQLPAAAFVRSVRGVSLTMLGKIVGEAGDLWRYANPLKLRRRMALAPHLGRAYATWRTKGGLTAEDWVEAKYDPARRSLMYLLGGGLIGGMGHGPRPLVGEDVDARADWTPYQRVFVQALRYEATRDPAFGRPAANGKESFSAHAALRAQRKATQAFLVDLWRVWHGMEPRAYAAGHATVDLAEAA